ncbi:heme peroxidase [Infundibulicybe gibba]|nr:heme peroxidase [Infundibulicybe gibba]
MASSSSKPKPKPNAGLFDCCGQRAKLPFSDPPCVTSFVALEKRLLPDSKAPHYNDRLNIVQEAFGFISKPENEQHIEAVNKSARAQFHNKRPIARRLGASHLHIPDCFPYVLSVDSAPEPAGGHPQADRVFDYLLQAKGERVDHANGVSGLFYALATILSFTLVRPRKGTGYNETSFFLDLSPLYGTNKGEEDGVRLRDGTGKLRPDEYSEQRSLTPSAAVLLIMFNRNHNWIADQLLARNDKWVKTPTYQDDKVHRSLPPHSAPPYQDDEIYKIARSINCAQFKNIIAGEFLTGLLGMTSIGHNTQLDLDLKNWSSLMSKEDQEYFARNPEATGNGQNDAIQPGVSNPRAKYFLDNFCRLIRSEKGCFNDDDLVNILREATDTKACAFGAQGSPVIEDARGWGVCSLNKFRQYLGLKPFKSFSEWNPHQATSAAAAGLYREIDNLELYAGLQAEATVPDSGFCLGYTMASPEPCLPCPVTLIRSDPNFTRDFKPEIYTEWGLSQLDCISGINNGAFGAQLPKIIMRNLPEHYRYNNIYGLFSLTTTTITKSRIKDFGSELSDDPISAYNIDLPRKENLKALTDMRLIREVLNNPNRFPSMYYEELRSLTEGYGYLLGIDDEKLHDHELTLTLYALMPDARCFSEDGAFYGETAERMLKAKHDSGVYDTLDVVKDVIYPTCLRWACEKLCGFDLDGDPVLAERLLQQFHVIHSYIFHTADPADGWTTRSKAVSASKDLSTHIEKHLSVVLADPPRGLITYITRLYREFRGGHQVSSTHSFLERLVKTSRSIGRFQQLIQEPKIKSLLDKIEKRSHDGPQNSPAHWLLTWLGTWIYDSKARSISKQQPNVIGLSVVSSVNCSLVKFYLAAERKVERDKIIELSRSQPRKIMGYIHEAMRLGPPSIIWRNVGCSMQVENPDSIDPDRDLPYLLGAGLHKCPAISLIDELFKVIFRQENLNWIDEKANRLLDLPPPPRYQTLGLKFPYPTHLSVTYKQYSQWLSGKKWKVNPTKPSNKRRIMDLILYAVSILVVLWRIYVVIVHLRTPTDTGSCEIPELDVTCREPTSVFQKWDTNILLPGPDGQPTPIEYTMDHKKPHRLTLLDIDARDMQLDVLVDGVVRGRTTDFELDKTVDCGEDHNLCLKHNFSAGVVVVPPGKHTVKIVWVGKEFIPGTNDIDWGDDYSRRMKWKLEHCA